MTQPSDKAYIQAAWQIVDDLNLLATEAGQPSKEIELDISHNATILFDEHELDPEGVSICCRIWVPKEKALQKQKELDSITATFPAPRHVPSPLAELLSAQANPAHG